jgi:hypothetical protein
VVLATQHVMDLLKWPIRFVLCTIYAGSRHDARHSVLQDFTEEQLQLYKEYQGKEKAAIEERLKRKAVMVRLICMLFPSVVSGNALR